MSFDLTGDLILFNLEFMMIPQDLGLQNVESRL